MIVLIRQTPGQSYQGLVLDLPEELSHLPNAVWHGSREKVKRAFNGYYRDYTIQYISLSEGWDYV